MWIGRSSASSRLPGYVAAMASITDTFHIDTVVADVEEAMAEISALTRMTRHSLQSLDRDRLLDGEAASTSVRSTYPVQDTVQLELANGTKGSF